MGCDVGEDVVVSGDVGGTMHFYNYHTSRLLSTFDLAAHSLQLDDGGFFWFIFNFFNLRLVIVLLNVFQKNFKNK